MFEENKIVDMYRDRRAQLLASVLQQHDGGEPVLVLFADLEDHKYRFRQESSFFYLTGVQEPGSVLLIRADGFTTLYIPQYQTSRSTWMNGALQPAQRGSKEAARISVDEIIYLGQAGAGYSMSLMFNALQYEYLSTELARHISNKGVVYTLFDRRGERYVTQHIRYQNLAQGIPGLLESTRDMSEWLHRMRKTKDVIEIKSIYDAVRITSMAQESAAKMIRPSVMEYEIQSCIESVFLYFGATGPSFPSIIASGRNTTTLHYTGRKGNVREGDLVLIDIGCELEGYCADITRTYPASGMFTDRQKEVYELVLQAQTYIETMARPGMYLRNADKPELSLHHLAVQFFDYHGCSKYFLHGIGHYLGLDVHDVGDYNEPLKEGDVFTIEPGLYLASEGLGVRIEDDYVIVQDGVLCLSEALPKTVEDIENLMNMTDDEEEGTEHE
jgi:Xaa-Pro aminopeptidase